MDCGQGHIATITQRPWQTRSIISWAKQYHLTWVRRLNHNERSARLWGTTREEHTVEIHVYGQDVRGLDRCRYNLESGAISPFTRKYDNC